MPADFSPVNIFCYLSNEILNVSIKIEHLHDPETKNSFHKNDLLRNILLMNSHTEEYIQMV